MAPADKLLTYPELKFTMEPPKKTTGERARGKKKSRSKPDDHRRTAKHEKDGARSRVHGNHPAAGLVPGGRPPLPIDRHRQPMPSHTERPGFDQRMSREEINSLPVRGFSGKIVLIDKPGQLDSAVAELAGEKLLGFDTETKPNFQKGQDNPPALLQLAGAKTVYIFQLKALGLPPELRQLLADPRIVKSGVAVDFDLRQLKRLSRFHEEGFVELATAAREAGIKNHGLRGLAAVLLGFRISKGAQRSNWGADSLSEKQLRYAATDAWVGREIFRRLEEMGVIYPELCPSD
jgi:hypothetical protein